ncbi:MAG: class IV adenylate cyclase [Xanthomonadales bacterium]|nr:class IV adenylate cyclase [Xanthomonadales bacterium]
MPRNVEIKARVDTPEALLEKVKQQNPHHHEELHQTDTFFHSGKPEGRVKLREFSDAKAQLLSYDRSDQEGPKMSTYSRCEIDDAVGLKATLEHAYGIKGVVEKVRHVYLVGQTRVHLDEVKNLGHFMELEVVLEDEQSLEQGEAIAQDLMQKLGIESKDLIQGAYMDLLLKQA